MYYPFKFDKEFNMTILKNNIKKLNKKLLVLSLSAIFVLPLVGCSDKGTGSGDEQKTTGPSLVNELKSEKLIGLQAALLKFTTVEKAGSIASVSLEEKEVAVKNDNKSDSKDAKTEKKYLYTLEVISKKGISQTMTIDAKTGLVINTSEKGPASAEEKSNLLNFVPVMDVDKAAQKAIRASTKEYSQVLSYKLFAKNGKTIFSFKLYNGDSKNTETILVDASTGEKLTKSDKDPSSNSTNDKADSKKEAPIRDDNAISTATSQSKKED